MARDRVFIDSNYRSEIEKMKNKDILGIKLSENKDLFMLAVALGLNDPEELKNRDGWFLMKNLKTADKSLFASVLLGTIEKDSDIDAYAELDQSLDLCERCAEAGFKKLKNLVLNANWDRELIEKRMMKELDLLYTNLVENDL